ncbi:MAG TPA: hypothetical protein VJA18_03010 [Candidatus Nanoarchaeia archaeon]|nr:hypothetical protein [Candidatus Nanoarchaeia archaeon]
MTTRQIISLDHLPVFDTEPDLSSGPLSVAELAWIGYNCKDPELARVAAGPWQTYVFGLLKNHEFETLAGQKLTEDLLLTIGYDDVLQYEREPRVIVPSRWQYDLAAMKENSEYCDAVISSYQVIQTYKSGELVMRAPRDGESDPDSYWTT